MLLALLIGTLLATQIVNTEIKTTLPVSIILDGFTLHTWTEQALWNKTRTAIVHHLNLFCRKDYHCDAEYGIGNVHLMKAVQYSPLSVQLNVSADEPVVPSTNARIGAAPAVYNYTALLTSALFQAKIDIERLHDDRAFTPLFHSSTHSHQYPVISRTNRLLLVLLGIAIVGVVFGLTVFFFQRIRRHSYSKLLKSTRTSQQPHDELLTSSPSTSALH